MTLIAGCRTWGGVCFATDTRVTHKPLQAKPFYRDDCQKCETVTGGLALAVAGDCQTASLFKGVLKKNFIQAYKGFVERIQNGEKLSENPITVLKEVTRESLIEVSNLKAVYSRPARDTAISGLIGTMDLIPLRLTSQECLDIVNAVKFAPNANRLFFKNSQAIYQCANGDVESIEISGLNQNALIAFENVLASSVTHAKLEVNEVPFGQVAVFGSGVSDDHKTEQYKTLAHLLLKTPEDDLQAAAFHLTRTHGWSDQVVEEDKKYGFKTFGGANLAMMLMPDPKDPINGIQLAVLKGKFHRKSDGKVVSDVYENDQGILCVKGEDEKEYVLQPFSKYDTVELDSLQLILQKP